MGVIGCAPPWDAVRCCVLQRVVEWIFSCVCLTVCAANVRLDQTGYKEATTQSLIMSQKKLPWTNMSLWWGNLKTQLVYLIIDKPKSCVLHQRALNKQDFLREESWNSGFVLIIAASSRYIFWTFILNVIVATANWIFCWILKPAISNEASKDNYLLPRPFLRCKPIAIWNQV